ncbi:MAG TPA: hypothetical protein VGC04_06185 [Cellulomonas sp.]
MRRLLWIGVGVGLTVVVVRYGRRLVAQYVPDDAARAFGTAAKVGRTARGVFADFTAGLAERETELRTALLGEDADPDAIKARGRAAWAELRGTHGSAAPARHVPSEWASGPLEDPDDDDGYAFF